MDSDAARRKRRRAAWESCREPEPEVMGELPDDQALNASERSELAEAPGSRTQPAPSRGSDRF
jgi:hypothetical protein